MLKLMLRLPVYMLVVHLSASSLVCAQESVVTKRAATLADAYFPQLGRHFKFDVTDMTVKTILNKVVKESPLAKIWLIKKFSIDGTFDIRLNARHEGLATSN